MYEVFVYMNNKLVHSFITNAPLKGLAEQAGYEYICRDLMDIDNYKVEAKELKPEDMKVTVRTK